MKAAVIGAGIMGKLLALKLLQNDWQVSVFDREEHAPNCSMAAAGMLTPFSELEKNDFVIFQLGMEALQKHWPAILAQLDSAVYFQKQGSLLVAHPRDSVELQRFLELVSENAHDKNILQYVNAEQIQQLEPQLTHFETGCFFADEGQIDNQAVMQKLAQYLQENGVHWRMNVEVDATAPGKISAEGVTEKYDWVFDCRGLAAKDVFPDLRGVRGELIWVHAPGVQQQRLVRLLNPRYNLYIVPRPDDIYILGASEIESEDLGPISVRTSLELLSAAYYVNPVFAEARILKTVTHCRPTLADHLPRINFQEGMVAVNGLYRHGFLLAPTLAEEIVRGVEQGVAARKFANLWSGK